MQVIDMQPWVRRETAKSGFVWFCRYTANTVRMLAALFDRLLQNWDTLLNEMSLNSVITSFGIPLVAFYPNSDVRKLVV